MCSPGPGDVTTAKQAQGELILTRLEKENSPTPPHDQERKGAAEPGFVPVTDDIRLDLVRDALARAMRHTEMAFIYIAERDRELTIHLLERFVQEAREVHKILSAMKGEHL